MANNQNLKILTPNEAREFGRMGGIASGKARKEYKKIREIAQTISSLPIENMLAKHKININDIDGSFCGLDKPNVLEAIIARIAKSAVNGNTAAAKLFLELSGAMPKNQSVNIIACKTTNDAMQIVYGHAKQEVTDT